jgi:hypothetical protein
MSCGTGESPHHWRVYLDPSQANELNKEEIMRSAAIKIQGYQY